MAEADLVLTSSRVVTPDGVRPAAIVVADGVIVSLETASGLPRAARVVDASDAAILPGVIDPHVHVNEPGRTEWEGFATATRAAAAGGVTTIIDMPLNSVPVTTTPAALEAKAARAAASALVDYGFWGGVVPGNLDALGPLHAAGALGFKCFLVPSGIDEFPSIDAGALGAAMARLAGLEALLLVHAELPGPIERGTRSANGADARRYATYLATRPAAAEGEAIALVLRVAAETGCAVHIVHLSSADGVEPIAAARAAGVAVSVETCPHYLTFSAEEIADGATTYQCAPPVRDRANRERLWTALARGRIDLVASDHSPCPPALKGLDAGNFLAAWGGIASLELSLSATWTGARARGQGLA
ncbi:MAG: allantoinase AllB, partial [Acidimicrobiales bacterium]